MKRRRFILRLLVLAAIAVAVVWAGLHHERFTPAALDAWLAGLGVWAPVAYVMLYAAGTPLLVPAALFALAGGALFGPVWGVVLNLSGATIGAAIAFLVARYLAGDWVAHKTSGRLKRLINGVEAEGWRFVALVRLVPLFPFNLTNYALGVTKIRFAAYVITSFVCMAPGAVAYTWLGHAGREALVGNTAAIHYGLLALGLLAAVAFLPRLSERFRSTAIGWIEAEDLRRLVEEGKAPLVLDVRDAGEFAGAQGHIPGALNIPLSQLEHHLGQLRPTADRGIVVVCLTDKRSARAQATLRAANFDDVSVLRGGMRRWVTLGFAVVSDACGRIPAAT